MNCDPDTHAVMVEFGNAKYCSDCGERLQGMQGPEQGLVGESRSARKQGHAEEAQPGERGVGEIGGAAELLRHVESELNEVRVAIARAMPTGFTHQIARLEGRESALVELLEWLSTTAEKRSDLSNDQVDARRPGTPNQTGG